MQEAAAPVAPKQLSAPRCRVAHVWLSEDEYSEICKEADLRGQHVDALTAELVITGVVALRMRRAGIDL